LPCGSRPPRSRPDWLRAVAVVYLYAALVALLLTFSRGGVAVGIAAVVLWLAIGGPRVESAAALGLALVPTLVVAGWAFSRPGLTKDAEPHSLQVHDGRWFGLALVLGGIGAFAGAFWVSRYERRRPLSPAWRVRLGRAGVAAGAAAIVIGIGGLIAAGITPSKVWHKFNEPAASPTAVSGPSHLGSIASTSRWNWWQEAWKAWKAHPALGTGAGVVRAHAPEAASGWNRRDGAAQPAAPVSERDRRDRLHPLPRDRGGRGGGFGRDPAAPGGGRPAAAAALVVALFAYVVHGVVDFDWDFVAVTGPALVALGVLLAAGRPARQRVGARHGVLRGRGGRVRRRGFVFARLAVARSAPGR
jgi:hypothetical protein